MLLGHELKYDLLFSATFVSIIYAEYFYLHYESHGNFVHVDEIWYGIGYNCIYKIIKLFFLVILQKFRFYIGMLSHI
jgi:hypothetical protein